MPRILDHAPRSHAAAEMFDLVADVERYPEFVPLCRALKVRRRIPEPEASRSCSRDMTVAYKLVREIFTSRVTLDRPNLQILVEYLEGPFSHLENRWTFHARRRAFLRGRILHLLRIQEPALGLLMGAMFDLAFRRFAGPSSAAPTRSLPG